MPLNPPSYLRLLKNTSQGFQHFFIFYNTKHLRFSVFHAANEGVLEKRKKGVEKNGMLVCYDFSLVLIFEESMPLV